MKIEDQEQEEIAKIAKTIIRTLSRENSKDNNDDGGDDNIVNKSKSDRKLVGGDSNNNNGFKNVIRESVNSNGPSHVNNNITSLPPDQPASSPPVLRTDGKLANGVTLVPQKPSFGVKYKSFSVRPSKKVFHGEEHKYDDSFCDNSLAQKRYKSLPSVKDDRSGSCPPSWMTLFKDSSNEFISEEDEKEEAGGGDGMEENPDKSEDANNNNDGNKSDKKEDELRKLQQEFEKLKEKISVLETLVAENGLSANSSTQVTVQQKINKERVFINIGGIRHETYRSTLKNIPDTRLSWIAEESATHSPDYDPVNKEFFFDRHPQVFSHILNYYRTGNMHVPYDVCGPLFEEELQYWGMDDTQVESCCWTTYRQHRDAQETLKEFEGIEFERDYDEESEPDLTKYGFERHSSDEDMEKISWYKRWQPIIWKIMEDPHSSKKAKVIAYISMTLIMLSVVLFCLETIEYFSHQSRKLVLTFIEGCCVFYFTIELVVRFIFCPDWKLFVKSALNWIDFLAIIPFFVSTIMVYGFGTQATGPFLPIFQGVRVIRVFRIIKLAKHSVGLQILGHTLKASFRELLLLIFFLAIGIIIFSSLVYYCEYNEPKTKFVNIPATFWWAVITMTTVGYGDMVPTTIPGKIIGGLCSICGVLMIALPVPVIVNNFNLYYSHAQARLKLPKKKRRVLCGAANALKGPAMEEFERREHSISPQHSIDSAASRNKSDDDDSLEGDGGAGGYNKESENEEKQAQLRMKRFSRRDSNMFSTTPTTAGWNGVEFSTTPITVKRSNYAMNKRRSLLPTIATLPEIEH